MESLPTEFVSRIHALYKEESEHVLKTFEQKKPTTFRVNTLKISKEDLVDNLKAQGFEVEQAPLQNAFVLKNKTQRELTETDSYKNGELYIQGLSSMIPPIIVEPKQNEVILDACSAPGSKTTQMADMMHNTAQIIANDMSKIRLYKLAANLKTLGVTNTQTVHMRAQDLWRKFPSTFDRVLVDVPCSLEGRFLTSNPKTYANWSPKKIKVLSEHQKHILRSAVSCAKPNSVIVYSTCTLSPEENEEVIDWILKKMPEVSLQPIELPEVETQSGVTEWNGKQYSEEVKKCVRIRPTDLFEGFFVAKLIKV